MRVEMGADWNWNFQGRRSAHKAVSRIMCVSRGAKIRGLVGKAVVALHVARHRRCLHRSGCKRKADVDAAPAEDRGACLLAL